MDWDMRMLKVFGVIFWLQGCHASKAEMRTGAALNKPIDWIAVGGGTSPVNNQISLEADLDLAATTLHSPYGRLLYAGGAETQAVQVIGDPPQEDVRTELAMILSPNIPRNVRYQKTQLTSSSPATLEIFKQTLNSALQDKRGTPLMLFAAMHGDKGEKRGENVVGFWGGDTLSVQELGEMLDRSTRPVRMVFTSCYSGGFADVVFAGANAERGAPVNLRCGFFATRWNRESTGCDPNPERRAQQGYSVHFWHAVRGITRDEALIPEPEIDFDHNGKISLLEAHDYVRIHANTIDIPTTTSVRWLQKTAPKEGPQGAFDWPEEQAVIEKLSRMLAVNPNSARAKLNVMRLAIDVFNGKRDRLLVKEVALLNKLSAQILSRWPLLEDPWHLGFDKILARNQEAIAFFLNTSTDYAELTKLNEAINKLEVEEEKALLGASPYERLIEALDNKAMAERLQFAGGGNWAYFLRVLGCEREGL
jgi:hypothetical protein